MADSTLSPYEQGRALWKHLSAKTEITCEEFALFSALEEVYDDALMRKRARLEREDIRREARIKGRANARG